MVKKYRYTCDRCHASFLRANDIQTGICVCGCTRFNITELEEEPTPDPVNHPPHYTSSPAKCKCGEGIECIQITEHMNFNIGNAIKYLWRADTKGKTIEDYKKAVWYITREIARLERE